MGARRRKEFTLYWSSMTRYEDCPQQFLWSRGWGNIDVGGGPGRRKPLPYERSEHHAVMGTVIGQVMEDFYNKEEWRNGPGLTQRLLMSMKQAFNREISRRHIDWRMAGSQHEMEATIKEGVLGFLRTMKAHKLLGPYAKSEIDMVVYVNPTTPIGGRADLILRRDREPYTGISIFDGKNSKRYKDGKGGLITYTDPDQLRFYALCFFLQFERMPDRLGFIYFRYPHGNVVLDAEGEQVIGPDGEPEKESGIVWVDFTEEDLKGLAARAIAAREGMEREDFHANPVPKKCQFCDFETVCTERQEQKAKNRRRTKQVGGKLDGAGDFVDL